MTKNVRYPVGCCGIVHSRKREKEVNTLHHQGGM
jgi:hypothetical protein